LACLAAACLAAAVPAGAAGWRWQSPLPQGNDLNAAR
jgi:hypothetical protein